MCVNYFFITIVLILLLLFSIHYNKLTENFDTFSPYIPNQEYPFVFQKNIDQKALRSVLKKWEQPFNTNNSGYLYNQHKYNPPYINLNSFEDIKKVRFSIPKEK
jgi:hypothetical protein